MESTNNTGDFNLISMLRFLWKWRKILLIVFAVSCVASVIISFLITPKYESVLIVIPSQMGSISRSTLVASQYTKDLMDYGKEEDCEHLIQIMNSSTIISNVCNHFNLMEHYGINPNLPYKNTRLNNKYINNISIKRTENIAVKITVRDKDPEVAMKIANYIGEQYDELCNKMKEERTQKALAIVTSARERIAAESAALADSLNQIHAKGLISYDNMADRFSQQLAKEVAAGNMTAINRLTKYLEPFSEYGGPYLRLRGLLDTKADEIKELDLKYLEVLADAKQEFSYKYIVDEPYVPDQKVYPTRPLIVLVSTLSAILMAIIILLFVERRKSFLQKFKEEN